MTVLLRRDLEDDLRRLRSEVSRVRREREAADSLAAAVRATLREVPTIVNVCPELEVALKGYDEATKGGDRQCGNETN
jgi:hypothetical protein